MNNIVVIAKIGKPYGLKGESKLYIFSGSTKLALSYGKWYLKKNVHLKWYELSNASITSSKGTTLIHFRGIKSPEEAAQFTNGLIGVPRHKLKEVNDEYYWVDVIGLKVINKEGQSFGQVKSLISTGSNDVLNCNFQNKNYLIPFVSKYVLNVDRKSRSITVDWKYEY